MSDYTATIGIECHVQLKTKTKLFSAVDNDARKAEPNTLISHIDVGMPGALPVLNKKAIELAARAAVAFGTEPQKFSKFDRKHYFYPDLPKGYQITQYENPIIIGGHVDFVANGEKKRVNITRVHLEEDAGKNTHPAGADYSLVDLNRAGTPLLEIVSEPDIHSAAEAKAYVRELWLLMKYAGVTDGDLYHGHMRFDVNTSISKDPNKPGIRTEVKNLNSFRSVENAINFEIDRQTKVLETREKVIQETRGWDEDKQVTTSQRGKEEAHDYRYMPEPDIPPVELSDEFIEEIKKTEAVLPMQWREELSRLGLNKTEVEKLLEAQASENEEILKVIKDLSQNTEQGKFTANQILNTTLPFLRYLSEQGVEASNYDRKKLYSGVYELVKTKRVSSNNAQKLLQNFLHPKTVNMNADVEENALRMGLLQVSDEGEIEKIVAEVILENPKVVEDIKAGQEKAVGFLVGQVMAKSQGKANPALAQKIIKEKIGE